MLDRDGDGALGAADVGALMAAVGRALSPAELAEMINKANPEVDGNDRIERIDFLALMAQAEFSALFLETFSLLDTAGDGWVEARTLWQLIGALVGDDTDGAVAAMLSTSQLDLLRREFDVDGDGHISYGAFVGLLLDS